MGFIRIQTKTKKGKTYHYFYYSERRRSHVKEGGDGKVRSIDRLIGNYANGKYLAFHLWDGLSLVDYAKAMIAYELKQYRLDAHIEWDVIWKLRKGKPTAGKLKFRAKSKSIDARNSVVRKIRERLQSAIDWMIKHELNYFANGLEAIAYHLASYNKSKAGLAKTEEKQREWEQDPKKEWSEGGETYKWADLAGDIIQSNMETYRYLVDHHITQHQNDTASLLEACPPGERERFKSAVIRQTEKLAASPNFLDRYETK
jgi:hypothetical protein